MNYDLKLLVNLITSTFFTLELCCHNKKKVSERANSRECLYNFFSNLIKLEHTKEMITVEKCYNPRDARERSKIEKQNK